MKKRFEKIKDKLDIQKFKEKMENLSIFKSKLDKLKDKLDDLDEIESEPPAPEESSLKDDSIRQKYKSIKLLGKTKQILNEYEALDDAYLAPRDLDDLKTDLAQISSEIKQ